MVSCFKSAIALLYLLHSSSANNHRRHNRRVLPYPLFPPGSLQPAQPPSSPSQPHSQHRHPQQPNYPFSSTAANTFFPSYTAPPPPLPSPPQSASTTTSLPTFQSNISSLVLPKFSSSSHFPVSSKLIIAMSVLLSLLAASILASLVLLRYRRCQRFESSQPDNISLYPPDAATSDNHPPTHRPAVSNASSDSPYLGTLATTYREFTANPNVIGEFDDLKSETASSYQKLSSPELRPLPPLPRRNLRQNSRYSDEEEDKEEFFSPLGSSGTMEWGSSSRRELQQAMEFENFERKCSNASYPDSNSMSPIQDSTNMPSNLSPHQNFSCRNLKSDTPGSTTAHSPRMMIPPPGKSKLSSPATNSSGGLAPPSRNSEENPQFKEVDVKSPPAVPPSCRFWETSVLGGGARQPMMGTPPRAPPS